MGKKVIYCCEEHVELGLDELVNQMETAPVLSQLDSEKLPTTTCGYCGKPAIYIVSN